MSVAKRNEDALYENANIRLPEAFFFSLPPSNLQHDQQEAEEEHVHCNGNTCLYIDVFVCICNICKIWKNMFWK